MDCLNINLVFEFKFDFSNQPSDSNFPTIIVLISGVIKIRFLILLTIYPYL